MKKKLTGALIVLTLNLGAMGAVHAEEVCIKAFGGIVICGEKVH